MGDRKDVPSYHLSIETPTPLSLGVGVVALVACCVFCAFGSVAQWEHFGSVLVLSKTSSRPSGSVPSAPPASPLAETS